MTMTSKAKTVKIIPQLTLTRIDESCGEGCCEVIRYATTEDFATFHREFGWAREMSVPVRRYLLQGLL
ncbi:hypothetical protein [Lacunimicrobium album]